MVSISVSDIQRDLPGYLSRVQAGESLLIVDQDHPIAELKPFAGDPKPSSVVEYLQARMRDVKVSLRWKQDGVAEPSADCRQASVELAAQLFSGHGLIPHKIIASRQEGIYLEYKSPQTGRLLGIEVDNELDVVAVVSDAERVHASGVFEGEEADRLLDIFFGRLEGAVSDPRPADA